MVVGRSGRHVVVEIARGHAVVLVVVTTDVVDAMVDAELRAVVDGAAGIRDLQVVDALFDICLGKPGERIAGKSIW